MLEKRSCRRDQDKRQLVDNGATNAEIDILPSERVELNAMTSDALIAMIEHKLKAYGLKKVVPDNDLLGGEQFDELESEFEASEIKVPKNLKTQVHAILRKHPDLRWDDAVQLVLGKTQLVHLRTKKQKAKKKSGDFTDADEDEDEENAP
jgi:hypothetical protein